MKTKPFNLKKIIPFVLIYLSLPLFIILTDPEKLPLPLLIVPFVLFFLIIFVSVYYLTGLVGNINIRRRRVTAFIASIVPVMLAILQSLHQLTPRDVLLSGAFILVITWYMLRLSK